MQGLGCPIVEGHHIANSLADIAPNEKSRVAHNVNGIALYSSS